MPTFFLWKQGPELQKNFKQEKLSKIGTKGKEALEREVNCGWHQPSVVYFYAWHMMDCLKEKKLRFA